MVPKSKPSFSKEYANKVSEAIFVEHFEKIYPDVDLKAKWKELQEPKAEEKEKGKK